MTKANLNMGEALEVSGSVKSVGQRGDGELYGFIQTPHGDAFFGNYTTLPEGLSRGDEVVCTIEETKKGLIVKLLNRVQGTTSSVLDNATENMTADSIERIKRPEMPERQILVKAGSRYVIEGELPLDGKMYLMVIPEKSHSTWQEKYLANPTTIFFEKTPGETNPQELKLVIDPQTIAKLFSEHQDSLDMAKEYGC